MAKSEQNQGCGWLIALVIGVFILGRCSSDSSDTSPVIENPMFTDNVRSIARSQDPVAMYITAASVNCRSGPATSFGKVESFSLADQISVSETQSGWSKIEFSDCWIASRFLSEEEPESLPTAPSERYSAPSTSRLFDAPVQSGPSCGGKWKCGQMDSCNEAYHYLNECGVGRLDGDGDGVPCESIC